MSTVSKTLTWQATIGNIDHYEIAIANTSSADPTLLVETDDAATAATISYDSSTYPTAWLFVRAIATNGAASDWSDPVYAESLDPTFTPPTPLQYAYANDVSDALSGFDIPATITTRMINKACLAASREIDRRTGRRFSPQTVVERYNGTGLSELVLNHFPVLKINYVRVKTDLA